LFVFYDIWSKILHWLNYIVTDICTLRMRANVGCGIVRVTHTVILTDICSQVNPAIVDQLESHGMTFVGQDVDAQRMEIMELQGIICSLFEFFIPSLFSL